MDASFWHQKWADNNIAFHNSEVNSRLVKFLPTLALAEGSRVFLPLCGKTLDIAWLRSQGYRVAGAELSPIAIEQLFAEMDVEPTISKLGESTRYSAENIDIFVGDIFQLSGEMLGPVDAIYDRAALVALPREMRDRYTTHLMNLTNKAPQLLICFDYDQAAMAGPPHSISNEEVNEHYKDSYDLTLAESKKIPNGLKGKCEAKKNVWLLRHV
ncbi:MAG: thiopurine S-methyltransferase [Cyanobacteria bacterium J06649_4]